MAHRDGTKSGGRQKGASNKASGQLKSLLDDVFGQAFANPGFRAELLLQITTLKIDVKLLVRLLEYWAGAPTKQVDHTHTVSLAAIIAGTADVGDDEDEG